MAFDAEYYNGLAADYKARRDFLCGALVEAGFTLTPPEGAYYVLAGYDAHSGDDDRTFAHWLAREVGIATVPVSSFLPEGERSRMVRFAFCKRHETLERAVERLTAFSVAPARSA